MQCRNRNEYKYMLLLLHQPGPFYKTLLPNTPLTAASPIRMPSQNPDSPADATTPKPNIEQPSADQPPGVAALQAHIDTIGPTDFDLYIPIEGLKMYVHKAKVLKNDGSSPTFAFRARIDPFTMNDLMFKGMLGLIAYMYGVHYDGDESIIECTPECKARNCAFNLRDLPYKYYPDYARYLDQLYAIASKYAHPNAPDNELTKFAVERFRELLKHSIPPAGYPETFHNIAKRFWRGPVETLDPMQQVFVDQINEHYDQFNIKYPLQQKPTGDGPVEEERFYKLWWKACLGLEYHLRRP
jgi:hypothetical protein